MGLGGTFMDKTTARLEYEAMSLEQLENERTVQEGKKAAAFETHEKACSKMTGSIVMTAFGLVFLILLPVSIPLLVIGIPKVVDSSKTRNRSNHEYNEASWRLNLIARLLAERKNVSNAGPEEVSGEVI